MNTPRRALRLLRPDDEPAMHAAYQAACDEGTSLAHTGGLTRDDFRAYWCGRGGEQWVAHRGELVLGGYTLRPNQPGRGAHVATATYVVAPDARGLGVGRALGEHSLLRARACGFRAVQFNFVVSTNAVAVRLWHDLGFRTLGTLPGAFQHPTAGAVDALVLWRDLVTLGELP
jgi:GNAT superfamily N-acetyltransferase